MERFVKIDKKRLTNGQHFSFMEAFYELLNRIDTQSPRCQSAVTALASSIEKEDKCMKLERGSRLTKLLQEQDEMRYRTYSAFKHIVKAWTLARLAPEFEAAKGLFNLINLYNINPKSQIDEETGLLSNLIGDIHESSTLTAAVKTLNLKRLLDNVTEANESVKRLLAERNQEGAEKVTGALKSARLASDEVYDQLIKLIESFSVTADDPTIFETIIREWNVMIERYKDMLRRKSTKDSPDEDNEETPSFEANE